MQKRTFKRDWWPVLQPLFILDNETIIDRVVFIPKATDSSLCKVDPVFLVGSEDQIKAKSETTVNVQNPQEMDSSSIILEPSFTVDVLWVHSVGLDTQEINNRLKNEKNATILYREGPESLSLVNQLPSVAEGD